MESVGSPLLRIHCDGNPLAGFGHLKRSQSLARGLKKRGFRIQVNAVSAVAKQVEMEFPQDRGEPQLEIFDLPESSYSEFIPTPGLPSIALDYFAEEGKQPDLCISIRERDSKNKYQPGRLSGFDYSIIREEIASLAPRPQGSGVLVLLGGADPRQLSGQVVDRLVKLGQRVTAVLGPFNTCEIQECESVRVFRSPDNLPELMADCAFAVASAGVSLTELMCLQKAVHVVPQSAAEEALAEELLDSASLLGIGLHSLEIPSDARRNQVAYNAREVVDGKGIDRISLEIAKFFSTETSTKMMGASPELEAR